MNKGKLDMKEIKNNYSRRGFFSIFSGFFMAICSNSALAEFKAGQPFRDRFQTYRQTFRIEPDPEEAKRIVKNIIKGREIRSDLINLKAPDIAENGNTVPISFSVDWVRVCVSCDPTIELNAASIPVPVAV